MVPTRVRTTPPSAAKSRRTRPGRSPARRAGPSQNAHPSLGKGKPGAERQEEDGERRHGGLYPLRAPVAPPGAGGTAGAAWTYNAPYGEADLARPHDLRATPRSGGDLAGQARLRRRTQGRAFRGGDGGGKPQPRPDHAPRLSRTLGNALQGRTCRSFDADTMIRVEAADRGFYADAGIACPPNYLSDRVGVIDNPTVVIEVLSPGTEKHDRGEKFRNYRFLASLRDDVLIASDRRSVEVFSLQDDGSWNRRIFVHGRVRPSPLRRYRPAPGRALRGCGLRRGGETRLNDRVRNRVGPDRRGWLETLS